MPWIPIQEQIPPDLLLKVKDSNGNEAFAQPTYYPFKVIDTSGDKLMGWGTPVPCDPCWDGGWIISAGDNLLNPLKSPIAYWDYIPGKNVQN